MIKQLTVSKRAIFAFLVVTLISACSDGSSSHQDLIRYSDEVKARRANPIEPIPEFAQQPRYQYQASNSRSPFEPFVDKTINSKQQNAPDTARQKEPLEAFPLDALRMVGVLERDGKLWAIIKAPDETIYRVTKGNYLGKNYGKIVDINNEQVKLIEKTAIGSGWEKREAKVAISEEQQ